jgi:hypothetical protein
MRKTESANPGSLKRIVRRIASFIRRMTVCKLGEHFNWKNHEPDRGIAGAGECLDCGVQWEGIKWPRPNPPNESSSPTAGGGSGGAQPKGTNEKED